MQREDLHISDQDLLLTADGEHSSHRTASIRAHLARCWDCRARMAEIESAIVNFARAHREELDSRLPTGDGPRALLRARVAELTAAQSSKPRRWFPGFASSATACAVLLATVAGGLAVRRAMLQRTAGSDLAEHSAIPDRSLTPGATRPVSLNEVCSMQHEETVKEVSADLRQRVFAEYRIEDARANEYEVDYLITPGLGGADDIHNLWPEPESSPIWNSHVKDALEERLHLLVCARKLDLPVAQHDIATNWVAAYKKYVGNDKPGVANTGLGSPNLVSPRIAALERMPAE